LAVEQQLHAKLLLQKWKQIVLDSALAIHKEELQARVLQKKQKDQESSYMLSSASVDTTANQLPSDSDFFTSMSFIEAPADPPELATPKGQFTQSPDCDAIMRVWLSNCAFADSPNSAYWQAVS
jgi:hypothetical protein